MSHALPDNSLTQEEVMPYALKALESFKDNSLTTGEVYRLADNLAVQNGESRYMGSQLVRLTLAQLAQEGRIFQRQVDQRDGRLSRTGQVIWLSSAYEPVPAWLYAVNRQIHEHTPEPRKNPRHQRSGGTTGPRAIGRAQPIKPRAATAEVATGRADLIVTLIRELERDAMDGAEVQNLRAENARLIAANAQLVEERNAAVKKARALERVYRTMGKLLEEEPDTPG